MVRFKYRFCKVHMARFVNGDLSEPVRRRVARYIDECDDCYREYMRHREFAVKLERSLPSLGRPNSDRLNRVWSAVQSDLLVTPPRPIVFGDFGTRSSLNFSYGLVIIAIAIALLLPMTIGFHATLLSVDLRRLPQFASIAHTPANNAPKAVFVGATAPPGSIQLSPAPKNTPAPSF